MRIYIKSVYMREAKCQLSDSKNYKVCVENPTTANNNFVNQTIDRFRK